MEVYYSNGARVEIIREEPRAGGYYPPLHGGQPPAWVRVGQELAAKRIREYMEETGRMPGEKLLEDCQREMGKRLDAYIREPMKCPFKPMGLREFEEKVKSEK